MYLPRAKETKRDLLNIGLSYLIVLATILSVVLLGGPLGDLVSGVEITVDGEGGESPGSQTGFLIE